MSFPVKAYHNGDDVFLLWRPAAAIKDCRGFAIEKKLKDRAPEILPTWIDFSTRDGDVVQYRVIPMVRKNGTLRRRNDLASAWTDWIRVTPEVSDGVSCFFNRGIVASQWVQRLLGPSLGVASRRKTLDTVIEDLDHPARRNILAGQLRDGLRSLLAAAKKHDRRVEAALFELTDEELIGDLASLGGKARVVLADGSTDDGSDENERARAALADAGVTVCNRITHKKYLAHNKMVAVYDN